MTDSNPSPAIPFAIYYGGDAYSTAQKIMGRQSAGKSFIRGIARTWPTSDIVGIGTGVTQGKEMLRHLQGDGFAAKVNWVDIPNWAGLGDVGSIYFPSPSSKGYATSRNLRNPAAFSIIGVTFTLSSLGATDQVADLILPPFKPWDAMICISQAALDFTSQLHDEMRQWWSAQIGATRFNAPVLPVIPLGVDCPAFAPQPQKREAARTALELASDEIVFLFAGRLSFHAKGNPLAMYQALEQVGQTQRVVCIEAGVFPNDGIKANFIAAQKAVAPSVRFIWVDGNDESRYKSAWQGADAFVSLSDNIQETFGLTPVEAMAAGLPVVVSDWNGYKETVRHGVDGFRIPTVAPPAGVGKDLAERYDLELDTYDFYIGRTSLATVVEVDHLAAALTQLAANPGMRATMGASGLARAQASYDWPVILQRYAALAKELDLIRQGAPAQPAETSPTRSDPFARFGSFPTRTLQGNWMVAVRPDAQARLRDLLGLGMANYAFNPLLLPREAITALLVTLQKQGSSDVNTLLAAAGLATPVGVRVLMWLWKFDLIHIHA